MWQVVLLAMIRFQKSLDKGKKLNRMTSNTQLKPNYLFLSSGSKGGISKYQADQIKLLLSKKLTVFLLDEDPLPIISKLDLPLQKQLNVICCPVWTCPKLVLHEINKIICRNKKVIICISNPSLLIKYSIFLFTLKKKLNVKLQLTLHSKILFDRPLPSFLGEFVVSVFSYILVDRIIFVSKYTHDYWCLRYFFIRKCFSLVILNSLEPIYGIKARNPNEILKIGFVGRLSKDKDPELFCRIAKYSSQLKLNIDFHIFGAGPLEVKLKSNFEDYVVFHGWQNEDAIYKDIDVLLITSPIENSPYVLLEAKNRGIPVVARMVGGIAEISQDGKDSLLVKTTRVDDFIDAILRIRSDYNDFSLLPEK